MFILFSADDENDAVTKELTFAEMPTANDLLNLVDREVDIDADAIVEKAKIGKGWHDGDHTLYHLIEVVEAPDVPTQSVYVLSDESNGVNAVWAIEPTIEELMSASVEELLEPTARRLLEYGVVSVGDVTLELSKMKVRR
jgi:hypothetical protein